jgi:hypothetical protein
MSSNISFCSSFIFIVKLWYSNSSIIMEYDDFVTLSSYNVCDFLFDPLQSQIVNHIVQYQLCV